MNVIKLCLSAKGRYTDTAYEENIFISEDLYNSIERDIKNLKVRMPGLDWNKIKITEKVKHDCINEKDIKEKTMGDIINAKKDGKHMYNELKRICGEKNLKLDDEISKAEQYFKENCKDSCKVTYTIPSDKKDRLDEFVKTLNK